MRVILTEHIADDRRTLAKLGVGQKPLVVIHRVQDAPLDWLESVADIGQSTKFNGTTVFTGATITVAVAGFSPVAVTIQTISTSATAALGMTAGVSSLSTQAGAQAVAQLVLAALTSVSNVRATIGAGEQQLSSLANSLGIQVENFTAAFSQIRDANIADEVVTLNKFQILNQSGTNALGQANQAQQSILQLLR